MRTFFKGFCVVACLTCSFFAAQAEDHSPTVPAKESDALPAQKTPQSSLTKTEEKSAEKISEKTGEPLAQKELVSPAALPAKKYSYSAGNIIWGGTIFDWESDTPPGFKLQWLETSIASTENIDRSNFSRFDPVFMVIQNFVATITSKISLFNDLKLILKKPEALPSLYDANVLSQAVIYDDTTFKVLTGKKSMSSLAGHKRGELAVLDLTKFDQIFGDWENNPDIRYYVLLQGIELEGPPTGLSPHELNVAIGLDAPTPQNGKLYLWYESHFGDVTKSTSYNMVLDFMVIGIDTRAWRASLFEVGNVGEMRVPIEWHLVSLKQLFTAVTSYGYSYTLPQGIKDATFKMDMLGGIAIPTDLEGKKVVLTVSGGFKGYLQGTSKVELPPNRYKGVLFYCKNDQICRVKHDVLKLSGSSGQLKTQHLTQVLPE
ncbi:hypothetical protein K1X76_03120 [bacterium]|nr:hypothetical protein [bacterium]